MSLAEGATIIAVSTIIGGIMGAGGSIAAYIDAFNKIPGHEQISRQEFLRGLGLSALQGFGYGVIGGLIFGVGLVVLIAGGASAPALLKAMGCLSATGAVQSAFMYFQNMQQGNTCSAMYNCITFALSAVGAVKCFEYAGQVNAANAAKAAAEKAKSGKTVAAKEIGTVDNFISKNVNSNFKNNVKNAFTSDAKVTTLTEDKIVYRYHGGDSSGKSYWYTPNKTSNPAADLALPKGNTYQYVDTCVIPKGTTVLEGTVAPNFGQPGGGYQYYVPDPSIVEII